jgi:hypothetical protein
MDEVSKSGNKKNATQVTEGRTEKQTSQPTKRCTASGQAHQQQIRPQTNQLRTDAREPKKKIQVLEQPNL